MFNNNDITSTTNNTETKNEKTPENQEKSDPFDNTY